MSNLRHACNLQQDQSTWRSYKLQSFGGLDLHLVDDRRVQGLHVADFESWVAPAYEVSQRTGMRGSAGRPICC